MPQEINTIVSPETAADQKLLFNHVVNNLPFDKEDVKHIQILRKSIDARQKQVKINLRIRVFFQEDEIMQDEIVRYYQTVSDKKTVLIIGAGPAGLFAALKLIEKGIKPIIIERGKNVKERRRDLVKIFRNHEVDPDSNYCFGEGGAGTYSDGKLYTRSGNKKSIRRILDTLIYHGAEEKIRINSHPHIGTNKLPQIITKIRETIEENGGEIHFNTKFSEFILDSKNQIEGIVTTDGKKWKGNHVILATGHSARDIYYYLHRSKIKIEFKPFALGVRVEHPQSYIDSIQYHCEVRSELLPAAPYSLVTQIEGKGVYSFCMCPGGVIAPCATSSKEIVTNGWSPSKRNNPFANAGIVVQVEWENIPEFHKFGELAGLKFQESVEKSCWKAAGEKQFAPAQRLKDFVEGNNSENLPECSYKPGVVSVRLDKILPSFIVKGLKNGFQDFDKKMKGFIHPQAIVVAPESRTSSPIRIPRDNDTLMHPEAKGLYPCAEGAGYAGGIISAALDGERIAEKIAINYIA